MPSSPEMRLDAQGMWEYVDPTTWGTVNPLGVNPAGDAVTPTIAPIEIDPFGPWLVTIDQQHHQQHEGEAFHFSEVVTLGSGATQDYLLTIPAGKYPHLEYAIDGLFGITVELYEATDKTQSAGAVTTFNRNRNSAKVPAMTIKKGTNAGSSDGTRILWRKSGSGTSQGKVAGSAAERKERILKAATKYILRITSAAASNDVSVEFDWYEEGATKP